VMALANEGTAAAVHADRALAHGVNVVAGQVVLPEVAAAHSMTAVPLEEVLS
jgi:alanine dehydrogenase